MLNRIRGCRLLVTQVILGEYASSILMFRLGNGKLKAGLCLNLMGRIGGLRVGEGMVV
jgi:hypothetical protein